MRAIPEARSARKLQASAAVPDATWLERGDPDRRSARAANRRQRQRTEGEDQDVVPVRPNTATRGPSPRLSARKRDSLFFHRCAASITTDRIKVSASTTISTRWRQTKSDLRGACRPIGAKAEGRSGRSGLSTHQPKFVS